jgi:Secretion system C-terminal sorting domain
MKKNYFLLLLAFLSLNLIYAEPCPQGASSISSGSKIVFDYAPATSFCINRPTTIVVNGTSTYTLDLGSCSEIVSVYNLTSGPAITGQDFTVTSGFDTACVYSGGTLPVEEYTFLSKNLKVYPNPLNSGNTLNLLFGLPIDAKLTMYSITGKEVFNEVLENTDRKDINVSNLSNGIYLLKLSTEKTSITRKVVILK